MAKLYRIELDDRDLGQLVDGLESGIMGLGLAQKKGEQGRSADVHKQFEALVKDPQFTAWLHEYYINLGTYAPNDDKIVFIEATRKIKAMAHCFEENGQLKESEKDGIRASLGKKIAHTEGANEETLFIRPPFLLKQGWILLTRERGFPNGTRRVLSRAIPILDAP